MSFPDVDECAEGSNCAQTCTNTEGSYTCSCEPGYTLGDNGACNGKANVHNCFS